MDFLEKARRLLNGKTTVAVTCLQWGDTGKGKLVDGLARWAKYVARGTGGANAGHTVMFNGRESIFHLIPSGILHDADGIVNILGSGVAFDPGIICEELDELLTEKKTFNNLYFSLEAHLVLPQHLLLDRLKERKSGGIGTTGRGIGPLYTDHYARVGLRLNDVLNKDIFLEKLKINLRDKLEFLKTQDREVIKEILHHEHLGSGRYWSESSLLDVDAIVEAYTKGYADRLGPMIRDTEGMLRAAVNAGENVLLEGAQGNWLSVDRGSYPFVTSSDCSIHGLAKGVGLDMRDIGFHLGIVKFPYMTRVGKGPFPTELGGEESAQWCCETKGVNREKELADFGRLSVNDPNSFRQGIAFRQAGGEYGATTKRPRRTGWLDLPMLRTSMRHSGNDIVLTKPDVLDGCGLIKICHSYTFMGDRYRHGDVTLNKGDVIRFAIPDSNVMKLCEPNYAEFPGWNRPISDKRDARDLPKEFMNIFNYVLNETGARCPIISVGADREQTIVLN
jgi:adenylosuccinate synthase